MSQKLAFASQNVYVSDCDVRHVIAKLVSFFFLLFHQAGGTTLNAEWPCQILRAEAWKAEQNFRSPRTC